MKPQRYRCTLGDAVVFLLGRCDSVDLNTMISLDGRVDERRLRTAVRRSLDAEPILGCRFVEHWWRPWWERRDDLDRLPLCEVVEGGDLERALTEFMLSPLDPRRDPLVQVRVFRGVTDTIVTKFAHEPADGPSIRDHQHLIFTLYRRLKDEPDFRPAPKPMGMRDLPQLTAGWPLRKRLKNLVRVLGDLRGAAKTTSWSVPSAAGGPACQGLISMALTPQRVAEVQQYCRARKFSITGTMIAATYCAARRVLKPINADASHIGTTVDFRRYLAPTLLPTPASNIAGGVRFLIDFRHKESLDQLAAKFTEELGAGLSDPVRSRAAMPVLTLYSAFSKLFAAIPFAVTRRRTGRRFAEVAARRERGLYLVNGGRQDDVVGDLLEVPVVDMEGFPPLFDAFALFVAFTGFGGSLKVSLRFASKTVGPQLAQRLLEQIDQELPCYPGTPSQIVCRMLPIGGAAG
jgi:NRPS condensation-like uncharacterized protein